MATSEELRKGFELGPWQVSPDLGLLRQGDTEVHLEPMVMKVLVLLASSEGEVVTFDQIVDAVWGGRATTTEAIVQKIKVLRDKLGDDPKDAKYIQTHHKIGYRLVCPVVVPEAPQAASARPSLPGFLWPAIGGALALIAVAIVIIDNWPRDITEIESVNSVAVCPFENMSTEAEQYFVDGFREQLISTLYRLPKLRVIKAACAADEFPADANVESMVSGSVQQAGGRVRIMAHLLAPDNLTLWSGSVDGAAEEVDEVFELHERVANRVRDAILGESETQVTASSRPANLEAYDLYLLGNSALNKRSKPELNRAVDFFNQAIELDPNFGPAYLGLANSYVVLASYPGSDREAIYDRAIETADEGARVDAAIRNHVGAVYGFVDMKRGNWGKAAEAFQTAVHSEDVYPNSHHWYSRFLANVGLLGKSLEQAQIAQELDTASPVFNSRLAVAYHWRNDSENANRYYDKAADQQVGSGIHNLAYTLFLIREQRIDMARQKATEALIEYGQPTDWVDAVFDGLADRSHEDSAASTVTLRLAATAIGDLEKDIELALWVLLGKGDKAMETAWALHEAGEFDQVEMIYLDEFRVLWEHEEFPRLLDALGLTEFWAGIGCHWGGQEVICFPGSGATR